MEILIYPTLNRHIGWLPRHRLTAEMIFLSTLLSLHVFGVKAVLKWFSTPAVHVEVILDTFLDQADVQLVYSIENVRGVTTHSVKDAFGSRDALERRVARTGLRVTMDEKKRHLRDPERKQVTRANKTDRYVNPSQP
jgi:hypothetical protein